MAGSLRDSFADAIEPPCFIMSSIVAFGWLTFRYMLARQGCAMENFDPTPWVAGALFAIGATFRPGNAREWRSYVAFALVGIVAASGLTVLMND